MANVPNMSGRHPTFRPVFRIPKGDWLSRLEDVMPKLRIMMAFVLITISLLAVGVDFFTGDGATDYSGKSVFEIP